MGQAKRRHEVETAGKGRRTILWLPLLVLAAGGLWWMARRDEAPKAPDVKAAVIVAPAEATAVLLPDDKVHAGYAGSESCKACHAAEYEAWKKSDHHFAERPVEPEGMDREAFVPGKTIAHASQGSEAKLDEKGLAELITLGPEKKKAPFTLKRVIGHDPLRQFLIEGPGGRLQAAELAWDPHRSEWFDVYGEEDRQPGEWGHWTGRGMNWNAQCASCHNTRFRKNYDPATDSYRSTRAELSIGCESCHGPMKAHVDWQGQKPPTGGADPTVKKLTRDQMLEACAACHARRGEITGDLVPGDSFYDHFSLVVPDASDLFYPDGQVRDEDYEFTAFLGSKMHAAGVRCVDCHDPHTGKRLLEGNALCMQCHAGGNRPNVTKPAPVIDPVAHSHHGEASTGNLCTSCHMPVTTYMQRHPRHDHGFTTPDPKLTVEFGIPNACNRCHTDQDASWAQKHTETWYGEKLNRPARERTTLLAKARRGDESTIPGLIALLKGDETPSWKASASYLLGMWADRPEAVEALVLQLKHPSPLVRHAAVQALGGMAADEGSPVHASLRPRLEDEARSVRVAAAWALRDEVDPESRAGTELVHMLQHTADQPVGQMQLGQYEFARNRPAEAIAHFRKAVEWDPNSPPFHHDLAIALSSTGDTSGAIRELQAAIKLAPDTPDYHYKLGLAWSEAGSLPNALASLERTVKLDPGMGRAWYNLSVAYLQSGRRQDAMQAAQQAAALAPGDPRVMQLLQSLSR